jgi:uncharacterized protein (TIGR02001 family)
MRKLVIVLAMAACYPAFAQEQAAEPKEAPPPAEEPASPHTLTGNVGLFSQYIFRGLTQTDEEPAIQGGMDYSHSSGFYLGFWGSNISFLKENFTNAAGVAGQYDQGGSLELDLYGGFKGPIGQTDFTYDLGALYYYYPGEPTDILSNNGPCVIGSESCPDADTLEVYAGLGWKWLSAKLWYSVLDDTFGFPDADGTYYLDLTAAIPIAETGLTLGLHYGRQEYDGDVPGTGISYDDFLSYSDYRVSLAYDLGKVAQLFKATEVGAMYTDTSGDDVCGYGKFTQTGTLNGAPCSGVFPEEISGSHVTVWLKRTF